MNETSNSSVALTTNEVEALRLVASGRADFLLSSNHKLLLTAMGLVMVNGSGCLALTQEGTEWLAERQD
jgi:hypothetical protein